MQRDTNVLCEDAGLERDRERVGGGNGLFARFAGNNRIADLISMLA